MKLSCKCRYGIRALFDIAFHQRGGAVQIREISDRQQIPPRFLEQIFQDLKRAGLVSSKRGPKGGFRLARNPSDIRLGDVLRALEGPVTLCPAKDETEHADTTLIAVTGAILRSLSAEIQRGFDAVSLESMCEAADARGVLREAHPRYVYNI